MKRQERKNDRTINIYKILTIVLAVVLIVVLIIFGRSWMVQKNAQKEYEKLSAQVNDLQNQVNDNQINIPSDTQTETENVAQEVQTEDSELEQKFKLEKIKGSQSGYLRMDLHSGNRGGLSGVTASE